MDVYPWPIFDTYGDVSDQFSWVFLGMPDFSFANAHRGKRPILTPDIAFDSLIEGVRRVRARVRWPESLAKFDECIAELEVTKQLCTSARVPEAVRKLQCDKELFASAYRLRRGPNVVQMKPPFLSDEEDPDVGDPDFEPDEYR